jgi:hypothetical protein
VIGCFKNAYFSAFVLVQFVYMPPVAGGIANTEEHRFVFILCLLKGFIAPGIPVHRIMGMLQEVRGFLSGQTVGEFRF